MGRVSPAVDINTVSNGSNDTDISDVAVSSEFRSPIQKLLERNKNLFTATDKDLGRNVTVKMRSDTGNSRPIKYV